MPKMRGFKPEIWTDEKFVQLTPLARLLFMGMWSYACDNGHLEDRPSQIKMRVLPADECDVAELVDEIVSMGMVKRSNGVLTIHKLAIHQRIDKRYFLRCEHCPPEDGTTGSRGGHVGATTGPRGGHTLKEVKEGSEGEGESKPASARKKPSKAIRDDWQPNAKHLNYAQERMLDIQTEAFRFRNHAIANDRRCVNWDAAFTNWLSNAKPSRAHVNDRRPEGWR